MYIGIKFIHLKFLKWNYITKLLFALVLTFWKSSLHVSEPKIFTSMERGMSEFAENIHIELYAIHWWFKLTPLFSLTITHHRCPLSFTTFSVGRQAGWAKTLKEISLFNKTWNVNLCILRIYEFMSQASYQSNIIKKEVVIWFSKLWMCDHLRYDKILLIHH